MTQQEAEQLAGIKFAPGWSFLPVVRSGELAGFVMTLGPEIHCFRLPAFAGRWLSRDVLESTVGHAIKEHGKATTKVRKSNLIGHGFVQRIGFVPVLDDGSVIHYECERLKHARL